MNRMVKRLMVVLLSVFMFLGTVTTPVQAKDSTSGTNGWGSWWGWWWPVQPTEPDPEPEPTEEPVVEEEEPVETEEPVIEEEQEEETPVVEEEAPVVEEAPAEEPVIEETEIAYPEFSLTSDEIEGTTVTVVSPEGALPEGTTMEVVPVSLDAVQTAVDKAADVTGTVVAAVDITFRSAAGQVIEPLAPITVTMTSEEIAKVENPQVVHVDTTAEEIEAADVEAEAVDAEAEADAVVFDAEHFSVYAVIDEGQTGENARLFVTFKQANGGADIVIPVKKTDIATSTLDDGTVVNHFEQVLYDPGVGDLHEGQMFRGWTTVENYEVDTTALTIEDVRTEIQALLESDTVKEGDTRTYYPMIVNVRYVSFFDELGATIKSDSVIFKAGETATYTIDEPYSPYSSDSKFEGWIEAIKDDETGKYKAKNGGTQYNVGAELTFNDSSESVYLIAKVPPGHWLIFKENGKGASYTSPQFIESEGNTSRPTDPTRFGYTFDGWYTDEECTDGNSFTFGGKLEITTILYAKWTAVSTARYTVIIWRQNLTGDGYDYEEVVTVNNAQVGSTPAVSQQGTGNNAYARINNQNKQYTGFHLKEFDTGLTVKPEGTTVVNVYYDRNAYTFTFQANANHRFGQASGGVRTSSTPWTTIHTVTRLYDQDISDIWSFTGSDGYTYPETNAVTSWMPQNNSTYTARITRMERMPATNLTFVLVHTDNTARYFHYYIETVDGAAGSRQYSGRQYDLYTDLPNDFNYVYYNDDFWELKGFTRQAITKSNDQTVNLNPNGNISWTNLNYYYGGTDNNLYFYYTRDKYDLNYMDGVYVDSEGVDQEETNRGQLGTVSLYYDADMSTYNKDQSDYFEPEFDGYTFAGWYYDKACVKEATFTTMPLDGITVYAKWIKNQYRIFLHPNVDASETNFASDDGDEYGMGGQNTSFRIDEGETLAHFDARRQEYELVGWYTDENFTNSFNFDAFVANDSNTVAYGKTESTETDDWGNPTEATNKDLDRYWITRKLDLYAKWRSKLTGAKGIQVEYYAVEETDEGTHIGYFGSDKTQTLFKDPVAYYNDNADTVAQGASSIDDETFEFKYWILQVWDEDQGKYVDKDDTPIYPGGAFTVLKADAKEESIGTVGEDEYYLAYTVRLRAHYGSIEAPTPTHINWYSNIMDSVGLEMKQASFNGETNESENGKGWVVKDIIENGEDALAINQAINIRPADTYSYPNYTFLGWAKIDTNKAPDTNDPIDENDLFLKWDAENERWLAKDESGEFNLEVTQVAADENQPYEDLYAVWIGAFNVVHSGLDNATDAENITTVLLSKSNPDLNVETTGGITKLTYDLTDAVTEGYLYGGYYEQTADVATAAITTNPAAYDGDNWTWTNMGSVNGNAIVPKAGATYYIKEVPADRFLQPYTHYTYYKANNNIADMWMISDIDDLNYTETGFIITEENKAKICKSLTVQNAVGGASVKLTPQKVFKAKGATSNDYLTYLKVIGNDAPERISNGSEILQYWITPDNMIVTGTAKRVLTGIENKGTLEKTDTAVASTIRVNE